MPTTLDKLFADTSAQLAGAQKDATTAKDAVARLDAMLSTVLPVKTACDQSVKAAGDRATAAQAAATALGAQVGSIVTALTVSKVDDAKMKKAVAKDLPLPLPDPAQTTYKAYAASRKKADAAVFDKWKARDDARQAASGAQQKIESREAILAAHTGWLEGLCADAQQQFAVVARLQSTDPRAAWWVLLQIAALLETVQTALAAGGAEDVLKQELKAACDDDANALVALQAAEQDYRDALAAQALAVANLAAVSPKVLSLIESA